MRTVLPMLLATAVACGDKDADSGHQHHGGDDSDYSDVEQLTEAATDGGSWTVSWAPTPDPIPLSETFFVQVTVAGDAAPVSVAVDATMPSHGHGMNVAPVTADNGDGTWTAEPLKFHMEGVWEIQVQVEEEDGSTELAVFNYVCCDA